MFLFLQNYQNDGLSTTFGTTAPQSQSIESSEQFKTDTPATTESYQLHDLSTFDEPSANNNNLSQVDIYLVILTYMLCNSY